MRGGRRLIWTVWRVCSMRRDRDRLLQVDVNPRGRLCDEGNPSGLSSAHGFQGMHYVGGWAPSCAGTGTDTPKTERRDYSVTWVESKPRQKRGFHTSLHKQTNKQTVLYVGSCRCRNGNVGKGLSLPSRYISTRMEGVFDKQCPTVIAGNENRGARFRSSLLGLLSFSPPPPPCVCGLMYARLALRLL
jgi:hypothetical protein